MLKDKGIGIGTVIEAVSTGIFDENSAADGKENGAINSTIEQEEHKNETGSSGKTVGNA